MNDKETEITEILKDSGIKLSEFHDVQTLVEEYLEYSKNVEGKKIDTGFYHLNKVLRGLRTQELMTIISKTGVGKSALILNFMLNFVKETDELSVLFSCEMSTVGIAERIFQIELDRFGFEIEERFIQNNQDFINQCYNLKNSLKNFVIITKRVDTYEIPDYIKVIEKMKNKKVRLIGVDYLGLLENKNYTKDEYLRSTDNMKRLYSYAKILDCAIINLSQTSRQDIRSGKELDLYSGKSSGEVENSSDFVITLERIEKSKDSKIQEKLENIAKHNEKFEKTIGEMDLMKIAVLKNRRGKTGNVYVTFNRKNLRIKEYSEEYFKDKLF